MRIKLKEQIRSDFNGYCYFASLNAKLQNTLRDDIILDFKNTLWFDANLCAVLGAMINLWQDGINSVSLQNIPPAIKTIFCKNWFLKAFGEGEIRDTNDTTVRYQKYRLKDSAFSDYVQKELLEKDDFPIISKEFKRILCEKLFEIFANAEHSKCNYVYACGQYYPQRNIPQLDFTIVDIGRTIKENVREFLNREVTGKDAIEWAIQKGHTTNPVGQGIPGGLGLDLIIRFVKQTRGCLQIVSDDGFLQINNGIEYFQDIPNFRFPGTIVNIEFNFSNKNISFPITTNDNEKIKF